MSFTRARSKLVIFGSRKTLEREPLLAQFFQLMQKQKWIARLPSGAHTAHARILGGCTKLLTKRDADAAGKEEVEEAVTSRKLGKENLMASVGQNLKEKAKREEEIGNEGHPTKKVKLVDTHALKILAPGVLKGRPILRDLVGNEI